MFGLTYSSDHYDHFQKHGDENYFEEVIDMMMLDNIEGMTDSFKETINNLPLNEKRMTILSLLDQDYNLFKQIKGLNDGNVSKMEHIKDVVLMLREYVKVGEVEKKKFGEVMTPLDLVKEMLSTLPEDVWSNPNLKWLDPANGTGPFPCMVIYRLMKGLEHWEPDQEKRYRHIVENMIYVCELQPKNMFLYMCAVDPFDTYKLNVYTGSFLSDGFDKHSKSIWGINEFDIILGNPPYQKKNEGEKKASPLWDKFVKKSLQILSQQGFLLKVHPNGWRNIDGDFKYIQNLLKTKLEFLNMNSVQKGEIVFGASTSYDFYLLRNDKGGGVCRVVDYDDEIVDIDISHMDIIPNLEIKLISSLIAKPTEDKLEVLHSYSEYETRKKHMSKIQNNEFKYPCVYSILKQGTVNLFYSRDKKVFFEPKIIFGNGANPTFCIDRTGEYGLTQFAFGVKGDLDLIERVILTKRSVIDRITRATKFISTNGNPIFYPKILSIFKKDFFEIVDNL